MSSILPSVINMVNTAFGVTVLAVPYCFHQCGLVLGCLLLVVASYASKRSCFMLLRCAQHCRKSDFESLGFHVGGFMGKSIVEMSLIGYLGGTCIAWFVVIGDVAPAVLSNILGLEKTWNLRMILIVLIGLFAVLPLSLVKDIKSLSSASNIAIGIYTIFVVQLLFGTLPKIMSGEWLNIMNFWKPDGMLQCIPIFVVSFLCQTVLFVIYESLYEPSVNKMEKVVSTAMNTLLVLSITVGFCGYVMFCDVGVEGDLLNNYEHDFISEFIRLGFCVSTVLSFPLLIFPCRVSINSMISSPKFSAIETSPGRSYISEAKFTQITLSLVVGSLIFGIIFPSVEFVMALVGATMGASLTYILPSYIFLKVSNNDVPKTEAKALLLIGICLFSMSTFTVLNMSESQGTAATIKLQELPRNTSVLKVKHIESDSIVIPDRHIKEFDSKERKVILPKEPTSMVNIAVGEQGESELREKRVLPLENPMKDTRNGEIADQKKSAGNTIRKLQKTQINSPENGKAGNEIQGILESHLKDKVDETSQKNQEKSEATKKNEKTAMRANFVADKTVLNESKSDNIAVIKNIVENNNSRKSDMEKSGLKYIIESNHQATSTSIQDGDKKERHMTNKTVNISSKSKSHERELLAALHSQDGDSEGNVSVAMETGMKSEKSLEAKNKQSMPVSKNLKVHQTKENL